MNHSKKAYQHREDCVAFVDDAAAYIRQMHENGVSKEAILFTLVHDICGLANREICFLPRVAGYSYRERNAQ